jgi:hypothetical protein
LKRRYDTRLEDEKITGRSTINLPLSFSPCMCGICMNIVSGFDCKQRIARRGRGGGGVGFKGVVEEEERQRQKKILQEKERW